MTNACTVGIQKQSMTSFVRKIERIGRSGKKYLRSLTMFYLQTIKRMLESIKENNEISGKDKARAKELLDELARLLAVY